ncbi:alcohol dehydrogenase [Diaporthe helianthi]|uniref:Alcohol dehydrogenase n=1 Tax=Diaporthe helianthi TaxID=158607 RepID=A0A2P5HJ07_DIAHE|nr:alcohol dehydrogenase [Diaporthe helianthi]
MANISQQTGRWILDSAQEGISSLHYEPGATFTADQVGPEEVLVEIHAASLNYRELAICRGNPSSAIPLPATPDVIPGSDGAGVVLAVGSEVSQTSKWLQPGVKVVTHMITHIEDDALPSLQDVCAGLGQKLNGTLCRQVILHQSALVPMPKHMSFEEAATLTCSGLTAWNALMGMPGREVKEGDWVLVQGTGGVSVAALQIAVAAGANVVAITSSDAKADRLFSLGARHVINYRKHSNWGELARGLTPKGKGIDHVVDVVGATTMAESLNAVRLHGLITVAGMVGGSGDGKQIPDVMSALWKLCVLRGIYLGSRGMFRDMVRFLEQKEVRPALDDVTFSLEDTKSALERLEKQQHFSKVIVNMA